MPGFSIENFRSSIERKGVIRTNHSQLIFTPPEALVNAYPDVKDILLRCETANLPSVWFTTDDSINRYGYGPIDKAPHTPQFDAFNATFLADRDGDVHNFFIKWMSSIINFDSSDTMLNITDNGSLPYEVSYRSTYITNMNIKVFKETTEDIMEYKLQAAWPSAIQEVPMSWNEQDNVVRLFVTFQYRDWKFTKLTSSGGIVTLDPAEGVISNIDNSISSPEASASTVYGSTILSNQRRLDGNFFKSSRADVG